MSGQKAFFPKPVLGYVKHLAPRTHGNEFSDGSGRSRRDILEFERDDTNALGKVAQLGQIMVGMAELHIADLPGGRVIVRRENMDAVTKFPRRDGEHAPQLPAA